jgi:hypothetical protein
LPDQATLNMEEREMRKAFVGALCAAFIMVLTAGSALAGEVIGPPGTPGVPGTSTDTAAPAHANSVCAFSGLNDFLNGQNTSIVQTAADSFKYYGLPHGTPGTACRGGTN